MDWLGSIFDPDEISGWDALAAAVILVAALILAHYAKKGITRLLVKVPGLGPGLVDLCARLAKYAIILLAVGIDLALLGANVQPLLAAVIIITAVGVIALRGVAANFGAGIIIQVRRSIHLGQEIEVLDHVGTVTELNGRAVVIATRDGRAVHIPNSSVLGNPVTNHSALGGRRSSLEVRVRTTVALDDVVSAVRLSAEGSSPGAAHPASVLVRSLSPGRATLEVRVWHEPLDEPRATSAAVTAVHASLSALGVPATVVYPVPAAPLTRPPSP